MLSLSRRRLILSALAAAALPVVACSAPAPARPTAAPAKPTAPSTAPTPAPAKPAAATTPAAQAKATTAPATRQVVKWRHATTGPSYGWVLQKMGEAKGYYKEEGIDIEFVTLNTDATLNKGLLAGEVESVDTGASSAVVASAQGAKVKVVGAWLHKLNHDLVVRSTTNSIKDLEGKNIAITSQGGLPHVVMLAVFDKHNIDPASVNFVSLNLANETHLQALIAGTVDSGVVSAELRLLIKDNPDVKVLTPFASEIPDFIRTTMMVTEETFTNRKEPLERFVRAYSRGVDTALKSKDDAVSLGMQLVGTTREVNEISFDIWSQNGWANPSGVVPMSSMEYMQDLNLKLKLQDRKIDLATLYDPSIASKVAKDLGLPIPS